LITKLHAGRGCVCENLQFSYQLQDPSGVSLGLDVIEGVSDLAVFIDDNQLSGEDASGLGFLTALDFYK